MRWYSAWLEVCAFLVLALLYLLWIYYMCTGQIRNRDHLDPPASSLENDADHHTKDDKCPACEFDHTPIDDPWFACCE
jgi:ABC-type nickel/cobalt efflux system permease component RcnA